jgi:hypothetical protein
VADPQIAFPDISEVKVDYPDVSTITPDTTTPEEARKTIIQYSPDPKEADAALQAADFLSPVVHPTITAQNPEIVAQELYGKPLKATGLLDKLKTLFGDAPQFIAKAMNVATMATHPLASAIAVGGEIVAKEIREPGALSGTIGTFNTTNQINALGQRLMSQRMAGQDGKETLEKIKELQTQAPSEKHLDAVPTFILQNLYSMGYQAVTGASAIADSIAMAVTLEPLRNMIPGMPKTDLAGMAEQSAEKFAGTFTGAAYVGAITEGIPHEIAAPVALGFGGLMAAATGLRIPALEKIAGQSTMKAGVSGALTRVMKQAGVQGAYGLVLSGLGVSATALATELNNLTQENKLPFQSALDIGKELGLGFVGGAMFGAITGAGIEIVRGGRLDQWARTKSDEIVTKQEAMAEKVKPSTVEPIVEEIAPEIMKLSDLMEEAPPRVAGPDPSEQSILPGVAPEPSSGEVPAPKAAALVQPTLKEEPTTPVVTTPAKVQPEGVPQARYEDFPISKVKAHPEILNFKEGANKKGVVEPLQGTYVKEGTAPIVLWESNDGNTYIITGRHRLDLAQRSGQDTIASHIFRESEGFTIDMARVGTRNPISGTTKGVQGTMQTTSEQRESQKSKHPAEDSYRKLKGKMGTLWERMPRMSFMLDTATGLSQKTKPQQ